MPLFSNSKLPSQADMDCMNDHDPKIGSEVSRRGFLKGAAIAGISAMIPAGNIATAVEAPQMTYAYDSVLEALPGQSSRGRVRFVGLNGHKHPAIHLRCSNAGILSMLSRCLSIHWGRASAALKTTSCPSSISAAWRFWE
jgi:hypothetical protein